VNGAPAGWIGFTAALVVALVAAFAWLSWRQGKRGREALRRSQAQAQSSEAALASVFQVSPESLSVSRVADGRLVAVNDAWCRMTGVAREAALGRTTVELGLWRDPGQRARLLEALRHNDGAATLESVLQRADGTPANIQMLVQRIEFAGTPCLIFATRDVTLERQRERLLSAIVAGTAQASGEAFFQALTEHLAGALGVQAAFVGEIVAGGERAQVLAFRDGQAFMPQFAYALAEAPCGVVVREGEAYFERDVARRFPADAALAERGIEAYYGVALRSLGGETIGLLSIMHTAPVALGDEVRAIMRVFATRAAMELERSRAEARLRESEKRFSQLFHRSLVPQIVTDRESRVLEDVNAAFCAHVGYERAELVGARSADLGLFWSPADDAACAALAASGGATGPAEISIRRKDGARRVVLMSVFPLESAVRDRVAWCGVDITEQREARLRVEEVNESLERIVDHRTRELSRANAELKDALQHLKDSQAALLQSEKLAALGRLVAGVAHELNTPIGNSLLSASALADRTRLFAREAVGASLRRARLAEFVSDATEASGILQRNLEKAAQLISSFKQVAADQASSQRRSFALKEVVDEVLLAHRPMLKRSPIEIRVDVPEGIRLDSYPGPLGQVLGNLVTNAVLHGYEGRDSGAVGISARIDAEHRVEIAVIDHGRGIPEADLARIFDPFFTTRLGRGGTGLGLGICHSIVVETLGGAITARSRPGEGATFLVRIPASAPVAGAQRAA